MWSRLRPLLAPLDPERVENSIDLGTPDVNIISGWIELKEVDSVSTDADHLFNIKHFTVEQRAWIQRRARKGGSVWVVIHVVNTDEWLVLDGFTAAIGVGRLTWAALIKRALLYSIGLPLPADLIAVFRPVDKSATA